jgi:hypothetical protein
VERLHVREDLLFDIAGHVDSTVHQFGEWGLPIMKIRAKRRRYELYFYYLTARRKMKQKIKGAGACAAK